MKICIDNILLTAEQVLVHCNLVEILSASSSSSEDLPSLSRPSSRHDNKSDDDTIPLVFEVKFHYLGEQLTEAFPNNTTVSVRTIFVQMHDNNASNATPSQSLLLQQSYK